MYIGVFQVSISYDGNLESFEETPLLAAISTYLCYALLVFVGHIKDFFVNIGLSEVHACLEPKIPVSLSVSCYFFVILVFLTIQDLPFFTLIVIDLKTLTYIFSPLYNIIFGVQIYISYRNKVTLRVKCIGYIGKGVSGPAFSHVVSKTLQ